MKRKMSNELEFDGDMKGLLEKHNNDVPNLLTTIASFISRKTKFFSDKTETEWGKLLFDVFNGEFSKTEKKRKAFEAAEKRRQEIMKKMEELQTELDRHKRYLDELNERLENDPEDLGEKREKVKEEDVEPGEIVEKPTKKDEAIVPKDASKSHTSKSKQSKSIFESPKKVIDKKRHHPASAYDIWFDEHREQIKKDNPNYSSVEINSRATQMWLNIEDTTEWEEKADRVNGVRNVRKLTKKFVANSFKKGPSC